MTKAMESGNMSELQALQSRSQSAAAAAGASRASYQDKREKLHQLTLSKDVKTRSAALVAYRKLVAQEKRVAGGLPPAAN